MTELEIEDKLQELRWQQEDLWQSISDCEGNIEAETAQLLRYRKSMEKLEAQIADLENAETDEPVEEDEEDDTR